MWWLIDGDVVAHCHCLNMLWVIGWICGGSLVEMWWLIGWICGGSLVDMWWLAGWRCGDSLLGDVVAHWQICGG